MSESATPTPGESAPNPAPSGEATEGSAVPGGETDSTADAFAAEREKLETRARDFQGAADKAKADLAKAQSELEALRSGSSASGTQETEAEAPLTLTKLTQFLAEREQETQRVAALTAAKAELAGEFKLADKSLFERATEFDTVEAFKAAVETSHGSVKSLVDDAVKARLQEVQEQTGLSLVPNEPDAVPAAEGEPSLSELDSMTTDQLDALEAKNPGVIQRVMARASVSA